ncbi:MAG: methionyl-tRNA formyltransferase [Alistipes sp.]|nr:methionyl-tRNA formyltransferase [Candidatus Alistipes equi]
MTGKDLRIVFMGTPEFAVPSLERLVKDGYNVVGVVTTPDRAQGRGLHFTQCDVRVAAERLGIHTILQPEKLKDELFVEQFRELNADMGIVIAFRMLPQIIWAMPKYGTFNLHASLLPQYRGAAPINWAIINGEKYTGLTTFLLNAQIDKGAIIEQKRVEILPEDNIGSLYDRLMNLGPDLVISTVEKIASGNFEALEQPEDESGLKPAPKIFKDDCRVDFSWSGERIINFVRGLSPYPAAWAEILRNGTPYSTIKIFEAEFRPSESTSPVGSMHTDSKSYLAVKCADGYIYLHDVQLSGKKRMSVHDLLLGLRDAEELSVQTKIIRNI